MCAAHRWLTVFLIALVPGLAKAELSGAVEQEIADVMPSVVAWRRDFHQHPELGNSEFRTAGIIADH